MDSERWHEVRAAFDELVELDASRQAERLAALQATDPELRRAVEALLQADADADARLAPVALALLPPTESPSFDGQVSDPLHLRGRTVAHFRILEPLGAGGMGAVYSAEDVRLGRAVALKLPLPTHRLDASAKARFLQEARSVAGLDHLNVCSVYEVGESEEGLLYLAMALYRGETLKVRLVRDGALPAAEAVGIARQVVQGLAAAHDAGVVHRDLKPANLMLLPNGGVKILDFGLAKVRDLSLTGSGTLLGTAAYMSPEQVRGDAVDGRADLWSLGVLLYEMLTGSQPFQGENEVSVAHAIVHEEPVRPSETRAGIPPALEDLVLSLLEKQPARRPATAQAVDAGLAAVDVAPGRTVIGVRRLLPARRRRSMLLAMGLVLLVALGAMITRLRPAATFPAASAAPPTTIAVLPFAYRGSQEFAYLGEGLVDLLSANLNGAGPIRTVDPDAILAQTREVGRDRLDPRQAQELALRLGAGSYVLGNVVETGGRLRISARLHSAEQEEGRAQVLVDGASTNLFQLVDGLTAQFIAQQNGGPAEALSRLAALTTDSLAALKAYLEAERHYRAWRHDSAVAALERAIRIDSSFALAHYRMATEMEGTRRTAEAREALNRALRHGDRLSARDRQVLEAFAAFLQGRLSEAERLYREIVTRRPDDLEATFQLGTLIHGRGPALGRSWLDARELLERVRSMDPEHQGAMVYLSSLAARERRLEQLDSLTDRILPTISPPNEWFYRGQRAVASGDTAEIERFIATLRTAGEDIAQPMGGAVTYTTGDLAVGRRIWRMLTEPPRSRGIRFLAHLTLAEIELMGGRWRAAKIELDSAAALDSVTALEHRVLFSLWPLQQVPRAELQALRDRLLRWKAAPGPSNERSIIAQHAPAHPYLRLYLLGLLSVRLEDTASALEYAAQLDRRSAASFSPTFVGVLARALRVDIARARGQAEQALALLEFGGFYARKEMRYNGDSPFAGHEYEQFTRAELLYAAGRREDAIQTYRAIADQLFHSGAPAHYRLAEIYERQGEREKAAAHYARFAELWKDCDPELRPLVEEARSRMAVAALPRDGPTMDPGRSASRIEPNLLAVAPFEVPETSLRLWREGLVDSLSLDLDGAGPLRTVAPSVGLQRWPGRIDRASAANWVGEPGSSWCYSDTCRGRLRAAAGVHGRLLADASASRFSPQNDPFDDLALLGVVAALRRAWS
jgi:tetratricopeptide (TPR) repeat protein